MELEPAGGMQDDLRFGLLLALLFNVNRDRKKTAAKEPADFFPSLKADGPEQSDEQISGMLAMIAAAARV